MRIGNRGQCRPHQLGELVRRDEYLTGLGGWVVFSGRLQRLAILPPGSQAGFPVRRDCIRPETFLPPALRL